MENQFFTGSDFRAYIKFNIRVGMRQDHVIFLFGCLSEGQRPYDRPVNIKS